MVPNKLRNVLSVVLNLALFAGSAALVFVSGFQGLGAQAPKETGAPTQSAHMTNSELKALVAPIALYPDNLVAETLAAATFPDQVAIADYWLQQHKDLKGEALVEAVDKQSWDASVKALTQFPSVLHNMAQSMSWTSQLGEAYHNQKSEVMAAVQALRAEAKSAGHLKSTPQIKVVQQAPQTIVIQPANPDVVYVPQYNPTIIYGTPYTIPGYSTADLVASSALSFGAGVALGAFAGGGWGWPAWGCNWSGGAVVYNHNTFYGNRAWHGGYVGGYHPYGYNGAYHPYGDSLNRNELNRDLNRNELNRDLSNSNFNKADAQSFKDSHYSDANSWAHHDNWAGKSTAFSGLGHSGFGGWSSRADSARGWGGLRSSGFSGFHGFGGHGFGGFHGGRR